MWHALLHRPCYLVNQRVAGEAVGAAGDQAFLSGRAAISAHPLAVMKRLLANHVERFR
jgi:hypothetical protein